MAKITIKAKGGLMKGIMAAFMSIPVVGVFLFFALWGLMLVSTIYGLYLAFSASIILGLIVLIVEPSPAIIGLVMLFFDKNLAQMIVDFLNK